MCACHRCQRDWPRLRKCQSVQSEIALLSALGFIKIMASRGGGAKRKRTLLYFNFIKKKKIREDEKNEQDNRQQGKH